MLQNLNNLSIVWFLIISVTMFIAFCIVIGMIKRKYHPKTILLYGVIMPPLLILLSLLLFMISIHYRIVTSMMEVPEQMRTSVEKPVVYV